MNAAEEKRKDVREMIRQSSFLLLLLGEENYMEPLCEIIKSIKEASDKVCYVCLSRPYDDILADLKNRGFDTKPFVFIDVLSNHYRKPEPRRNCIFLDPPGDLDALKKAIEGAVEKEKCGILLFDTISALLIYQEEFPILEFTNSLKAGHNIKKAKKVYVVLKDGGFAEKENSELISDLKMFAEKTVDFECDIS